MSSFDPIPPGPALYLSVTFRRVVLQVWAFNSQLGAQAAGQPNSDCPGHTFLVLCHQPRPQGCGPPGNRGVLRLSLLWQRAPEICCLTTSPQEESVWRVSQTLGSSEMNVAGVAFEGGSWRARRRSAAGETAVQVTSAPTPAMSSALHQPCPARSSQLIGWRDCSLREVRGGAGWGTCQCITGHFQGHFLSSSSLFVVLGGTRQQDGK